MLAMDEDTTAPPGLMAVRPKAVFGLVEARWPEENSFLSLLVPPTQIGSVTLLEAAILLSLARLVEAKAVFEFGTYRGGTTLTFAANLPHAQITSLDIGPQAVDTLGSGSKTLVESAANDDLLRHVSLSEDPLYLRRAHETQRQRIRLLHMDSRQLDPSALGLTGQFDLVFVDGGHDAETIAADTANAFSLVRPGGVVAWHDYGSPVHGEVTAYIDALAMSRRLIRVEASSLVFFWPGFVG